MNARLRIWWSLRSEREQRLLLVMGGALSLFLVWFAIIRPIDNALADARERHAAAVLTLATIQADSDEIRRLQRTRPSGGGAELEAEIASSAAEAGITLARSIPEGKDALGVTIDAVRPGPFFGWLGDLEKDRSILVDTLVTQANSDSTLGAEVRLRKRPR